MKTKDLNNILDILQKKLPKKEVNSDDNFCTLIEIEKEEYYKKKKIQKWKYYSKLVNILLIVWILLVIYLIIL